MFVSFRMNQQDFEGKTPLHLALENNHEDLIQHLLNQPEIDVNTRDQSGQSAFSVAMARKNNKAAQAILHRSSSAAEQVSNL